MSQMIVRYTNNGGAPAWGRLTSSPPSHPGDEIEVIELLTTAATTDALISTLEKSVHIQSGPTQVIRAERLLSPITSNATLVCQGLNYSDHAHESGHGARKENLLFSKASSALCGPYDNIIRPPGVELLDYEVEVGLVLRADLRAGAVIGDDDLGAHVAGVVLCNDVSARDVMFGASFMQWYQGKSYRTFCPTGPVLYLLDRDEVVSTLANLQISLFYKGEKRQSATTAQLIYKPAETLTHIAQIMDLKCGDLVLTGTPGGVLARATPTVVETLRMCLLDDVKRRAELRVKMKESSAFLEPGDVLKLFMRDLRLDRDLGGQCNQIASA